MKYVVYEGKVTECKFLVGEFNERMTYSTFDNLHVANANSDYYCDENGKSFNTGEYYNYKDSFFPWKYGEFDIERLKLRK